jgi:hypothetical protein
MVAGCMLLLIAGIQLFTNVHSISETKSVLAFGIVLLVLGGLLLPFPLLKIKGISGKIDIPSGKKFMAWLRAPVTMAAMLLLWVIILLVGNFVLDLGKLSALILPILAVLGVIIPIFQRTDRLDDSRGWGALSAGITISPLLGNVLEFGFLVIALLLFIIFITQNTTVLGELEMTLNRLASGQENPEILSNMILAFFQHPVNRFLLFALLSGVIPIIEEAVKQVPVWLLAWRRLTPRDGVMIGALGGAGFALTESLLTISVMGGSDQWWFLLLGRAGAGLMHITTGAISGWGLASAISGVGTMKAACTYILSILIHALWNGLVTWEGINRVLTSSSLNPWHLSWPGFIPLSMMGLLFMLMVLFLIFHKKILKE